MTEKISSRPSHADSIGETGETPASIQYNLFFDDTERILNSLIGDSLNLSGFSYTVATVPVAADNENGLIIVSDGSVNRRLAVSDGTNWRFPDGDVIS